MYMCMYMKTTSDLMSWASHDNTVNKYWSLPREGKSISICLIRLNENSTLLPQSPWRSRRTRGKGKIVRGREMEEERKRDRKVERKTDVSEGGCGRAELRRSTPCNMIICHQPHGKNNYFTVPQLLYIHVVHHNTKIHEHVHVCIYKTVL